MYLQRIYLESFSIVGFDIMQFMGRIMNIEIFNEIYGRDWVVKNKLQNNE